MIADYHRRAKLKNVNTKVDLYKFSLSSSFRGAFIFSTQLDTITCYYAIFEFSQMQLIHTDVLIALSLFTMFLNIIIWVALNGFSGFSFKCFLTFICFGFAFTPVIRSLTTSISSDTIYIMSLLTFMSSLVFHDYGIYVNIVSSPFSVNLCVAASVFLISRMETNIDAFLLLTLAVCTFSFWPTVRNHLFDNYYWFPFLFTIVSFLLAAVSLFFISGSYVIVFVLLHIFILVLCPILFYFFQEFKEPIHASWDEPHRSQKHLFVNK